MQKIEAPHHDQTTRQRPIAAQQQPMAVLADNSPPIQAQRQLGEQVHNSPRMLAQRQVAHVLQRQGGADFETMFTSVMDVARSAKAQGPNPKPADKSKLETAKGVLAAGDDKATQGVNATGNVIAAAGGVASAVDSGANAITHGKNGIGESTKAKDNLSGIGDSFGVIKETFFAVKDVLRLANEAQEMSSDEKFHTAMSAINHALGAAKSGVSAAKTFYDTWGGGAAGPLMQAVPGLGIALSCVDLIIRGYDAVVAYVRGMDMQTRKRDLKTLLGGKQGQSAKDEAERILKSSDPADVAKQGIAQEYLLAKGLEYVNQKRKNRAFLKIFTDMVNIAGDATTLGGVTAPVGAILKGVAAGVNVGSSIFRAIKQAGRDKAAEAADDSIFRKIFNADKSSDAKLAGYNKTIDQVLDMIIQTDSASGPAGMQRCDSYIQAMGFSIQEMYRYRASPTLLRDKMVESLKRRE